MTSRICYDGSGDTVELGDRVEYRTVLLRRKRMGTVVHIPRKTALELAREGKNPQNWLIKLDDGTFTGWLYHPEDLQPGKRLRLLARASGPTEEITNEDLERMDAQESGSLSGTAGLWCFSICYV